MSLFNTSESEQLLRILYGRKNHVLRRFQVEICLDEADYELLKIQAEEVRKLDALIRKVEDDSQ